MKHKAHTYYASRENAREMRDTLEFYGIPVTEVKEIRSVRAGYFKYPEMLHSLVLHIFTEHGFYEAPTNEVPPIELATI